MQCYKCGVETGSPTEPECQSCQSEGQQPAGPMRMAIPITDMRQVIFTRCTSFEELLRVMDTIGFIIHKDAPTAKALKDYLAPVQPPP